jgi:hypothetical protein
MVAAPDEVLPTTGALEARTDREIGLALADPPPPVSLRAGKVGSEVGSAVVATGEDCSTAATVRADERW